jgi:hypothetical protein
MFAAGRVRHTVGACRHVRQSLSDQAVICTGILRCNNAKIWDKETLQALWCGVVAADDRVVWLKGATTNRARSPYESESVRRFGQGALPEATKLSDCVRDGGVHVTSPHVQRTPDISNDDDDGTCVVKAYMSWVRAGRFFIQPTFRASFDIQLARLYGSSWLALGERGVSCSIAMAGRYASAKFYHSGAQLRQMSILSTYDADHVAVRQFACC